MYLNALLEKHRTRSPICESLSHMEPLPGQKLIPDEHGVEGGVRLLLLGHVGLHGAPKRPCVAPQEVLGQLNGCTYTDTHAWPHKRYYFWGARVQKSAKKLTWTWAHTHQRTSATLAFNTALIACHT